MKKKTKNIETNLMSEKESILLHVFDDDFQIFQQQLFEHGLDVIGPDEHAIFRHDVIQCTRHDSGRQLGKFGGQWANVGEGRRRCVAVIREPKQWIAIRRFRRRFDYDGAGKLLFEERQNGAAYGADVVMVTNASLAVMRGGFHGRNFAQRLRHPSQRGFHGDVAQIAVGGIQNGEIPRVGGVENGEGG